MDEAGQSYDDSRCAYCGEPAHDGWICVAQFNAAIRKWDEDWRKLVRCEDEPEIDSRDA